MVPLALLDEAWRGDGTIIILEPRRLAARAAARRMAVLVDEAVGGLVGYQTRDERRIGASTRVQVLTEGILTRRLQHDPELPGVAAVLFDEVHERNLTTDLGLALTLDAATTLRPDLRIVAMSATADTGVFSRLLACDGRPAPVVESAGRMFPVDVRWRPRRRTVTPSGRDRLEDAVGQAVHQALRDETGDLLVFLPGIGEILRVRDRLADAVPAHVDVRALAGALTIEEQDLALAPSPPGRRRVVLATDIAETSLTVAGVSVVVDSGLARAPRFDAGTGMTRLTTITISRDSADQRAGRAGRTGPGTCYRLWSKIEHGSRPAHRVPEMLGVDLSGFALEVAAWGSPLETLEFADAPPPRTWRQGIELLEELGAVDSDDADDTNNSGDAATDAATDADRRSPVARPPRLTALGRAMVSLPLHPRLARMVATSPGPGACVVAAIVDERDLLRGRVDELPTDLSMRVSLVCGHTSDDRADRGGVRRVRQRAADLARRIGCEFDTDLVDPDRAGLLLLAGFPDRLAGRRRPGQFQLRSGAAAWMAADDPLATAPFVVAADLDGRRTRSRIRLAAAVDPDEIAGVLESVVEYRRLEWDRDRDDLVLRVERRLDALRLDEQVSRADAGADTTAALLSRVRSSGLAVLRWTPGAAQLRARIALLLSVFGEPWPDFSDRALLSSLDEWLGPFLDRAVDRSDLERLDVATILRSRLVWPIGAQLDELAPRSWLLPSGREVAIDYTADRPTASVRVQDVFGVRDHPTVAGGRVPLTVALLSPADRPIQVTSDLPGFWTGSWSDVRKDLAGRYPKHRWPDDPSHEPPGRLTGR